MLLYSSSDTYAPISAIDLTCGAGRRRVRVGVRVNACALRLAQHHVPCRCRRKRALSHICDAGHRTPAAVAPRVPAIRLGSTCTHWASIHGLVCCPSTICCRPRLETVLSPARRPRRRPLGISAHTCDSPDAYSYWLAAAAGVCSLLLILSACCGGVVVDEFVGVERVVSVCVSKPGNGLVVCKRQANYGIGFTAAAS